MMASRYDNILNNLFEDYAWSEADEAVGPPYHLISLVYCPDYLHDRHY